jgi:hypothetical protein
MKLAKTIIVICVVLLIILAEVMRFDILRRMEMGLSVSEYELQVSRFLQALSFAPVGLAIGVASLFFPQHLIHWLNKLLGRARPVYSLWDLFVFRLVGLFFILATIVALWTTGNFLIQ